MITPTRLVPLLILLNMPFSSSSIDLNDLSSYNTPLNRAYALATVAGLGFISTWARKYSAESKLAEREKSLKRIEGSNHTLREYAQKLQKNLDNTHSTYQEKYKDQEFLTMLQKEATSFLDENQTYESDQTQGIDIHKRISDELVLQLMDMLSAAHITYDSEIILNAHRKVSQLRQCWQKRAQELKDARASWHQKKESALLELQASHISKAVDQIITQLTLLDESCYPYAHALLFEAEYLIAFKAEKALEPYLSQQAELFTQLDMLVNSKASVSYPYKAYLGYLTTMLEVMSSFMTPLLQKPLAPYQEEKVRSLSSTYKLLTTIKKQLTSSLYYKLECQQYAADQEAKAQRARQDAEARRHEEEIRRQKAENDCLQQELSSVRRQLGDLSSTIDSLRWQVHTPIVNNHYHH